MMGQGMMGQGMMGQGMMGQGMMGQGMMGSMPRHHTAMMSGIPAPYTSLSNPLPHTRRPLSEVLPCMGRNAPPAMEQPVLATVPQAAPSPRRRVILRGSHRCRWFSGTHSCTGRLPRAEPNLGVQCLPSRTDYLRTISGQSLLTYRLDYQKSRNSSTLRDPCRETRRIASPNSWSRFGADSHPRQGVSEEQRRWTPRATFGGA